MPRKPTGKKTVSEVVHTRVEPDTKKILDRIARRRKLNETRAQSREFIHRVKRPARRAL